MDLYNEEGSPEGECEGCGGWGLAASNRSSFELAIGAYGGLVTIWNVNRSGIAPIATLELSGAEKRAEALGIAFDEQGDVFAGNYPTNTIDEFTTATIAAGGGPPDRSFKLKVFSQIYYLAATSDQLLVDGWDKSFNFIVADVTLEGARTHTAVVQTLGSQAAGTGFPGGLAVDAKDNLVVDNQYAGTLATYAKPWTGAATSTLSWGYKPNDYTGITLDPMGQRLWAANIFTEASTTTSFGVADSYPLGVIGTATTSHVDDQYVGAALIGYDH